MHHRSVNQYSKELAFKRWNGNVSHFIFLEKQWKEMLAEVQKNICLQIFKKEKYRISFISMWYDGGNHLEYWY